MNTSKILPYFLVTAIAIQAIVAGQVRWICSDGRPCRAGCAHNACPVSDSSGSDCCKTGSAAPEARSACLAVSKDPLQMLASAAGAYEAPSVSPEVSELAAIIPPRAPGLGFLNESLAESLGPPGTIRLRAPPL